MSKKTVYFNVLRGTLSLKDGVKVYGTGSTDDADIIKQLEELAAVKTRSGDAQYLTLSTQAASEEVEGGVLTADAGTVNTQTTVNEATGEVSTTETVVKYPASVSEADAKKVSDLLSAGGLTWETANALSDEDIKAKTDDIGPARLKIIRAVGTENGYPEFQAE